MRLPHIDDVIRFSRLSATLEHIEATSTAVIPSEVPDEVSDSIRLYISCPYSDKPVVTGTFSETGFKIMRDLLVSRTGKDSLRDTPCAIFDVCPSSPLRWSELGCHDLRSCAQNAIPVQFISMPLAGALAPDFGRRFHAYRRGNRRRRCKHDFGCGGSHGRVCVVVDSRGLRRPDDKRK